MNHKKVAIVAVALVALLAIAGIGAAYAYTASTKNVDNDSGVQYLKMKPVTEGEQANTLVNAFTANFTNNITLDTETTEVSTAVKVTYTLNGADLVNGHKYIALGHVYLIIDNKQSQAQSYTLKAVMSAPDEGDVVNTTDFAYMVDFEVANKTTEPTSATDLGTPTPRYVVYGDTGALTTIDGTDASANYTFVKATLYVGLKDSGAIADSVTKDWSATPISTDALKNATITFTAEVA